MDLKTFLWTVFVAGAFVAWPNLSKALKVSGGLIAILVVIATLIVVLVISHKDLYELKNVPIASIIWIVIFAGANGLAVYIYAQKTGDPRITTGILLATVYALQVILSPIADWLVTKTLPTWQQSAGIGLVLPGIWLIVTCGRR